MAIGSSPGRVDAQGRIVIPQRFREGLQGGLVLARGLDQCIDAYSFAQWEKAKEPVDKLSRFNRDARTLRRLILGSAYEVSMDKQGRVVVPPKLREYAGIAEEVEIVGQDTYFEIWAIDKYAEQEANVERMSDIAAALEGLE